MQQEFAVWSEQGAEHTEAEVIIQHTLKCLQGGGSKREPRGQQGEIPPGDHILLGGQLYNHCWAVNRPFVWKQRCQFAEKWGALGDEKSKIGNRNKMEGLERRGRGKNKAILAGTCFPFNRERSFEWCHNTAAKLMGTWIFLPEFKFWLPCLVTWRCFAGDNFSAPQFPSPYDGMLECMSGLWKQCA